jgi:hypothetical protein
MVMADSKLEITDPLMTDNIMNQVSVEYNKYNNRKQTLINILVFIGIEFILFASVWMLLIYYPGYEYFRKIMNDLIPLIRSIGELIIKNGYLIVSIFIAYVFHWILNLKSGPLLINSQ